MAAYYFDITTTGSYGYKKGDKVPATAIGQSGSKVLVRFKTASGKVIERRLKRTTLKVGNVGNR